MSYESAPATKLLATHCVVCNRPLVDALSVELGIGPDCRRNHGFDMPVSDEARIEANAIVHAIACEGAPSTPAGAQIYADRLAKLGLLGFDKLALVIVDRNVAIRIRAEGQTLTCESPYVESFSWEIRNGCPGARWDRESKRWSVAPTQSAALWRVLKRVYPAGTMGVGPKGAFVIP